MAFVRMTAGLLWIASALLLLACLLSLGNPVGLATTLGGSLGAAFGGSVLWALTSIYDRLPARLEVPAGAPPASAPDPPRSILSPDNKILCSACGWANDPDARTCRSCGHSLRS